MTVTSTLGSQTEDNRKGASCIQPQDGAKFAITLISCSPKFDNFHPWRVRCLKQTDLQLSTTQHGRSILLLLAQLVRNLPALVIVAPGLRREAHAHGPQHLLHTFKHSISYLSQLHVHFASCNAVFRQFLDHPAQKHEIIERCECA